MRQASSVTIRTEPAGHALLPEAPDTYAPAHDGRRPCHRSRALQYPSGTGSTNEYPPRTVLHRRLPPAGAAESPSAPTSTREHASKHGPKSPASTTLAVAPPRRRSAEAARADPLRGVRWGYPAGTVLVMPWHRAGAHRRTRRHPMRAARTASNRRRARGRVRVCANAKAAHAIARPRRCCGARRARARALHCSM